MRSYKLSLRATQGFLLRFKKHEKTSVRKYTQRVFSGIQPTGIPHIGNYLGAIKSWVEYQERFSDVMYSIVDLHSITVPHDPGVLRENTLFMAAALLGCGLDPEHCILFQQSKIGAHAELTWILGCLCTLPRLGQLPQWREKSEKIKDPGLGLFMYPILQTADILLYKATIVPVGEDQAIHINMSRSLARTFNNYYSQEIFPEPEALISEVAKIRSLRSPQKKMSKSDQNSKATVFLDDSAEDILIKMKKAVTDNNSRVTYDPVERPGVSNLVDIYAGFTGLSPEEVCQLNEDKDTGQFKIIVAEMLVEKLAPIREKTNDLLNNKDFLLQLLRKGEERAKSVAEITLKEVKNAVGFL